jgi:predicted RNA-binding Zn-ribbon protein involved in translation (DUF1610 family)
MSFCDFEPVGENIRCKRCGFTVRNPGVLAIRECPATVSYAETPALPSVPLMAWNLAKALAAFVADGCKTVTHEQYEERLKTCDGCEHRHNDRCSKCGCFLHLKARGRAFQCPANKWPQITS